MAKQYAPEVKERARELLVEEDGNSYRDVKGILEDEFEEVDGISPKTIGNWNEKWQQERDNQERLENIAQGKPTSVTVDDVHETAKKLPGVGSKKADALRDVVEMRESILKDPNELYRMAHKWLETDKETTEHFVRSLYPHLTADNSRSNDPDPMFGQPQQNQQSQFQPGFQQRQQNQQQQPPSQQQFTPPGQSQASQQGQGQMAMMMRMFQQHMEQQQQLMEELVSDDGGSSEESDALREIKEELRSQQTEKTAFEQMKELLELQEMMEPDEDDGGRDAEAEQMQQFVTALQREIAELRDEVQDDGGFDMDPSILASGDSNLGTIALLAQQSDMDAEAIQSLAAQATSVESDPNVAEKKFEKEIKELEMEASEKKWDSILGAVEDSAESILALAGQAAGGDGGGGVIEQPTEERKAEVERQMNGDQTDEPTVSPAQQRVEEEIDPSGEVVMVDEEELDEFPEVEEVDATDEQDGGDEPDHPPVVCPGCGAEFETEQAFYGHKSGCDDLGEVEE